MISVTAARDISSQLTLIVSAHSWLCFDVRTCFSLELEVVFDKV